MNKITITALIITINLASCSSDDQGTASTDETSTEGKNIKIETPEDNDTDKTKSQLIVGTWKILSVNGNDVTEDPKYSSLRQAFQKDGIHLRAKEIVDDTSTYWGVDGGMWRLDEKSGLLTTIALPDSTMNNMKVLDVSAERLTVQSPETGAVIIWEKSADHIDLPQGL